MKVTPLFNRVVVVPEQAEEMTAGGLYLPESTKDNFRPQQGEVMAIGTGKIDDNGNIIPVAVSVGQKILFGKYTGAEVTIGGSKFIILYDTDILAVLE